MRLALEHPHRPRDVVRADLHALPEELRRLRQVALGQRHALGRAAQEDRVPALAALDPQLALQHLQPLAPRAGQPEEDARIVDLDLRRGLHVGRRVRASRGAVHTR